MPDYILSLSYGKDSLACLGAIEELGWPLEWKDIAGYEGYYRISNTGAVYSVRRNKILVPDIVRGYKQVSLQKNGKKQKYKVHRLVAMSFIPNPYNLPVVNHKDENKINNRVDNLEWCTVSYNNSFGTRTNKSRDTQIKNAPLSTKCKKVLCVDTGIEYKSTKEAERLTGIYHSHISRCCNGKTVNAGGLRWVYA